MKKAFLFFLALTLTLSACLMPVNAESKHFHFVFEDKTPFAPDFDWNEGQEPAERPEQPEKPATPTDIPDGERPQEPDEPQEPERPAKPERPACKVTDTDVTCTDVTCTDILDAIVHLKHHGHHSKDLRIPLSDLMFEIIDMMVNEDGTIDFGYVEKGKEDEGVKRLPMVTDTDVPEGMKFITMGDNNTDGSVNAVDALNILKHAVGKEAMEHEGRQILSDMNEDTKIDANDALDVLKKAVGK